jgi:glycosyltransferase involved in cell wall biosynthesis
MAEIDIVLASYEGAKHIREQLESISNQDLNCSTNLIVTDDLSKDDTFNIVSEFLENKIKGTFFLRPQEVKNLNFQFGPCANFSYGLTKSSAEYIMFCDQDDCWLPNKVSDTFNKMQEIEAEFGSDAPVLVFTDLSVVDSNLKIITPSFFNYQSMDPRWCEKTSQLMIQNVAPGCTMMVNRALLDLALPIPQEAVMHDWWLILVASAFGKVSFIDKPTMLYRQHCNNQVGAKKLNLSKLLSSFNSGAQNLVATSKQTKVFLERYNTQLNSKLNTSELAKLERFACYATQGYTYNLASFLLGYYKKNNLIRNIGLLLAIHWNALKSK